jgi:hypothetical protein
LTEVVLLLIFRAFFNIYTAYLTRAAKRLGQFAQGLRL